MPAGAIEARASVIVTASDLGFQCQLVRLRPRLLVTYEFADATFNASWCD